MAKFKIKIFEARVVRGVFIVEADDFSQALDKAMTGDTVHEQFDPNYRVINRNNVDDPELLPENQPEDDEGV